MKTGFLVGGLLACGMFSTQALAQSGGVWGQGQNVWSSSGQSKSGLWVSNSAVWSAGSGGTKTGRNGSSGHGSQSAMAPYAAKGMESAAEKRIARDRELTRIARKAAGIDPDNPGADDPSISTGYVDQFGLSHPGSIVMNGRKIIAMPDNANDSSRNYGVTIPTLPRSAGDGSSTGSAVTGTFISSSSQKEEAALQGMVSKESGE